MAQVEKLNIFLASPSDVRQERALAQEVVNEINRTVAQDKGVFLYLVNSERAIPGYGKDGQTIINEQIGDMRQYELFIGIMWNRIGTPTPRDISGTVEEFARAVKALQRRKKPQIWFYFREAGATLKTQEELDQRAGVLKFRAKLRGKGLFSEYTTTQNFEKKFREHLVTWLNARSRKVRSAPGTRRRPSRKGSADPASARVDGATAAAAGAEPKMPPARKPIGKPPVKRGPAVAKSPGTWIMLDDHFYQARSTVVQADRSVVLRIAPSAAGQIADLRALQPSDFHRRRDVAYADRHEAGTTQVQSVVSETSQGKTLFTVTLAPLPQFNTSSVMTEFSFNAYSPDAIAELRARLILLGQSLPKEIEHLAASSYQMRSSYSTSMASSIHSLPQLWTSLHTQPQRFLPQAWLYAAFLLKTGNIVERIFTFELGPIKDRKMRVTFRGRRAQAYTTREPFAIDIEGECILES